MQFFPKVAPHASNLCEIMIKVCSFFRPYRHMKIGAKRKAPTVRSAVFVRHIIGDFGSKFRTPLHPNYRIVLEKVVKVCIDCVAQNTIRNIRIQPSEDTGQCFKRRNFWFWKGYSFFDWNVNSFIWTISQMETKSQSCIRTWGIGKPEKAPSYRQ